MNRTFSKLHLISNQLRRAVRRSSMTTQSRYSIRGTSQRLPSTERLIMMGSLGLNCAMRVTSLQLPHLIVVVTCGVFRRTPKRT